MNGLLPYNSAGLVDPYANAMQGGLGQMYAIQQQQADSRDQDQRYANDLNTYQNTMLDNPNKQGARDLLTASQGIQKDQASSGLLARTMNSELEAKGEVARGESAKSKIGPQLELAAQKTGQFLQDLKSIDESGAGPMGQYEYWQKNVAPMFEKMGGPPDFDMARLERVNKHLQSQTVQSKHMEGINTQVQGQLEGHRITAAGQLAAAQVRANKGTSDAAFAEALNTLSPEERLNVYREVKTQPNVKTAITDKANTLAELAIQEATTMLEQAKKSGDKGDIAQAQAALDAAKEYQKTLVKNTMNLGRNSKETPKSKESPKEVRRGVSASTGDTWVELSDGTKKNLGKQ